MSLPRQKKKKGKEKFTANLECANVARNGTKNASHVVGMKFDRQPVCKDKQKGSDHQRSKSQQGEEATTGREGRQKGEGNKREVEILLAYAWG